MFLFYCFLRYQSEKKENFAQVSRLSKRMIIFAVQHSPKHVMIIFRINKIHEGLVQTFQWYVTNRSDFQNQFLTYSMIYQCGKVASATFCFLGVFCFLVKHK